MAQPSLIVMAAGLGSRFGGLKQMEGVGPSGEAALEYAVYDALRSGFAKVVFVLRREMEADFRACIGRRIEPHADVRYAFQALDDLPEGVAAPDGRAKPWGTGHAVLSCRRVVAENFAAINADDFYGRESFEKLAGFLRGARDEGGVLALAMVGFRVDRTLSPHGHVARGVCRVSSDGFLIDVVERTRVQAVDDTAERVSDASGAGRRSDARRIAYEDQGAWRELPPDSTVSMNMWGFTPAMMAALEERFRAFLAGPGQAAEAEFFLPGAVGDLVRAGRARVRVLPTEETWFGVTYRQDLPAFREAIRERIASGEYPEDLWGEGAP